jgi:eukaryotic-like serine/threonine-protein kinase
MSEPSEREEALFEHALGLASDEARAAYLRAACGQDSALRERIEALLRAHFQAGKFLQAPPECRREEPFLPGLDAAQAAGQEGAPLPSETPGQKIGHYKLLERIGEGGFGEVWMAEQEEPVRRRVALKILKLGMDTRQVVARFEAERQALALMDHPNIAHVYDGGATESGRPYFVMELVRGMPITKYCDAATLSTAQRLELFRQVCQAVQHAHQKGVIHRDLKPSNILVSEQDGRPLPKVIDFGVAKAVEGRLTDKTLFTSFRQMIGTPTYMSPEQAALGGFDIDTRSDIYSLGVLLYELLTGSTPFDTQELLRQGYEEVLRAIRDVDPPKPSTRLNTLEQNALVTAAQRRQTNPPKLVHLLRGDLDWIVMRCLEKDRARRYDTANGLALDIERYLHNEPVLARPPSALYRWQKFARRNKEAVAAAAVVALALTLGAAISGWQWRKAVRAREGEAQQREQADARAKAAAAAKEEANHQRMVAQENLYAADMSLAQRALEEGNLGRAQSLLEGHRPRAGGPDFRGFEWRYLLEASQSQSVSTLRGHASEVWSVAFSPDGKTLATASWDHTVKLWDLATKRLLTTLTNHGDTVNSVAFSPDGRTLATASSDHWVRLFDPITYTVRSRYNVTSAYAVVSSPMDSNWIVASGGSWIDSHGDAQVINDATGREVRRFPKVGNRLAISRDGRRLATGGDQQNIAVWDLQTGAILRRIISPTLNKNNNVLAVTFSADGGLLASSDFAGRVQVWDLAIGQLVCTPIGHGGRVFDLAFAPGPDENLLAVASSDATIRLWTVDARARSARPVRTLRGHTREVSSLAFSSDGTLLTSGGRDGIAMIWNLGPSPGNNVLTNAYMSHTTCRPVLSLDGKSLTAMTSEQSVGVWDLATGELLSDFQGESFALAVSSNAQFVVTLSTNLSLQTWNVARHRLRKAVPLSDLTHVSPARNDSEGVFCATLSADGKTLVTGQQNGTIVQWDALTGARLATLRYHRRAVRMMAFSSDGRRLLTAGRDKTSKLLDLVTHQELFNLPHPLLVFAAAFSPDEKTLVTGSIDAALWDAASGQEIAPLKAHKEGVFWVAFSPSGKPLATASDDRTVKLWNIATRREVATIPHEKPVLYAGFTPDGRTLVTGTLGGPIYLWRGSDGFEDNPEPDSNP